MPTLPPLPPTMPDGCRLARWYACHGLAQAEACFATEVHRARGLAIGARTLHLLTRCLLLWARSRR